MTTILRKNSIEQCAKQIFNNDEDAKLQAQIAEFEKWLKEQ